MSTDILDDLESDHTELRRIFSAYTGLPFHDPERKELVDRATALLMHDMRIETGLLYPLARELPDSGYPIEQARAENAEIEALLLELGRSDQDSPGFDRLVAQLVERATGHANHEEAQFFPALREGLGYRDLAEAGERAQAIRRHGSTAPRPETVSAQPRDDLPPAERGVRQRVRDLFSPAGSGQRPGYSADTVKYREDPVHPDREGNE